MLELPRDDTITSKPAREQTGKVERLEQYGNRAGKQHQRQRAINATGATSSRKETPATKGAAPDPPCDCYYDFARCCTGDDGKVWLWSSADHLAVAGRP